MNSITQQTGTGDSAFTLTALTAEEADTIAVGFKGDGAASGEIKHIPGFGMGHIAVLICDFKFTFNDAFHFMVGVVIHQWFFRFFQVKKT